MNLINFILILVSVLLNSVAQLLLKQGMTLIGSVPLDAGSVMLMIFKAAINPYILVGIICYVASFPLWLVVLSKVEVSVAFPFLSLGYIVAALVGYFFMGETLSAYKIAGILTICLGIGFMFKA